MLTANEIQYLLDHPSVILDISRDTKIKSKSDLKPDIYKVVTYKTTTTKKGLPKLVADRVDHVCEDATPEATEKLLEEYDEHTKVHVSMPSAFAYIDYRFAPIKAIPTISRDATKSIFIKTFDKLSIEDHTRTFNTVTVEATSVSESETRFALLHKPHSLFKFTMDENFDVSDFKRALNVIKLLGVKDAKQKFRVKSHSTIDACFIQKVKILERIHDVIAN